MLVVDDDGLVRELLRESLSEEFEVIVAASGQEALNVLERGSVDVILADQRMPGMSGVVLSQKAHELHRHLVTVLLSAYTDPVDMIAAINAGEIFRFVPKPWDHHELVMTLRQAAEHGRLTLANEFMVAELERRLKALEIVQDMVAAGVVGQVQHPAEVLLRRLAEVLPFDLAGLYIDELEGRASSLVVQAPAPVHQQEVKELCDHILELYAYISGKEALVGNVFFHVSQHDGESHVAAQSQVHVPLLWQGRTAGVLLLHAHQPCAFPEDAARLLNVLANGTADALQTVQESQTRQWQRLRAALAALPDGVMMVNRDGEFVLTNHAARKLLGVGARGGDPSIWQRSGLDAATLWRLAATGREQFVNMDGKAVNVRASWMPAAAPEGGNILVVLRDETERHDAFRRRADYFATITHEIRTPLSSMIAALEILQNAHGNGLTERQKRYVELAQDAAESLEPLVNDLLASEKSAAWELPRHRERIDPAVLVKSVVQRFQAAAAHRSLRFVVEVPEALPHLTIDARRVEQAVSNLCANAIKFSAGGTPIDVHIAASKQLEGFVVVGVRNVGEVLEEHDVERIFERFEQGPQASGGSLHRGTGLGLTIARSIAFAHGGWLLAEPVPDGASFWLVLPVQEAFQPQPWRSGAGPWLILGSKRPVEGAACAAMLAQGGFGVRLLGSPLDTNAWPNGALVLSLDEGDSLPEPFLQLSMPSNKQQAGRLLHSLQRLAAHSGRAIRPLSPLDSHLESWLRALDLWLVEDADVSEPVYLSGHDVCVALSHLADQLDCSDGSVTAELLLNAWRAEQGLDAVLELRWEHAAGFRAAYGLARWQRLREAAHAQILQTAQATANTPRVLCLANGMVLAGERGCLDQLHHAAYDIFRSLSLLHLRRDDREQSFLSIGGESVPLVTLGGTMYDLQELKPQQLLGVLACAGY